MKNIKDRLISSYFRLFTEFVTLKTFMLVAHGKYVTSFNLRNIQNMEHFVFEEEVRIIAHASSESHVYVVLNNSKIFKFHMDNNT